MLRSNADTNELRVPKSCRATSSLAGVNAKTKPN